MRKLHPLWLPGRTADTARLGLAGVREAGSWEREALVGEQVVSILILILTLILILILVPSSDFGSEV